MTEQIVIEPDGTVRGLYSDELADALRGVGPVTVERASQVEYDNGLGGWTVQVEVEPRPLVGTFRRRDEALRWERAYLDARLAGGTDAEAMVVASRSLEPWTAARGCAPSLTGLSPEEAIRRGRE